MINSLTDQGQVKAWADIYTTMKGRWKQSMILGFIEDIFLYLIL